MRVSPREPRTYDVLANPKQKHTRSKSHYLWVSAALDASILGEFGVKAGESLWDFLTNEPTALLRHLLGIWEMPYEQKKLAGCILARELNLVLLVRSFSLTNTPNAEGTRFA